MSDDFALTMVGPDDWDELERLFGPNGACGGCWCMYWRAPSTGMAFHNAKGEPNRAAFRALVKEGSATGVIARFGDVPVGWASAGPRSDFAFLRRTRHFTPPEIGPAWSVTCFFVPARWRHRGVAGALLGGAIGLARQRGAEVLEGYPSVARGDKPIPAAFAHTGVPALFEQAGFSRIKTVGARAVYRLAL